MRYLIIIILSILTTLVISQEYRAVPLTREVTIIKPDSVIEATIAIAKNNTNSFNQNRIYYWYEFDEIHHNQGFYSGQLLNGVYKVFGKNQNLIEQGQFRSGLKNGTWMQWDNDGRLIHSGEWEDGLRKGVFKEFQNGEVVRSSEYKDGVLHGKTIIYAHGVPREVIEFKDGEKIEEKQKDDGNPGFWNKIFKGNKKSTEEDEQQLEESGKEKDIPDEE